MSDETFRHKTEHDAMVAARERAARERSGREPTFEDGWDAAKERQRTGLQQMMDYGVLVGSMLSSGTKPGIARDDWVEALLAAERNLRLLGIEIALSPEGDRWRISIYNKGAAVVRHSRSERRRLEWAGSHTLHIDVPRDEGLIAFQKRKDRECSDG